MNEKENIHLADIEKALEDIREEEKGNHKIRACLFNLIIYTQDEQRYGYYQHIVQMVINKFPCRVLFVKAEPSSDEGHLKTSVSVASIEGGSDKTITCDQIMIEVSGKHIKRVPFIILPHILPDLPVYLLWAQDPTTENGIFPHLKRFASRIIFDSEATDNIKEFAITLLSHIDTFPGDIADLNWARLQGWRQVLANVFNNHEKHAQLCKSKQIQIFYNSTITPFFQHTSIQAIYLQAWLAAQLRWHFIKRVKGENGERCLHYQHSQGEVLIHLIPEEHDDLPPGAIVSIVCQSSEQHNFCLTLGNKAAYVKVSTISPQQCTLPYNLPLTSLQWEQSLVEELFHRGTSSHYRNMLRYFSKKD